MINNIPEEVKDLYNKTSIKKNYRIHFKNGERDDICNPNIVSESAVFTESICSADNLSFGLAETPSFKFTSINVGNIKGCFVHIDIEIDVSSLVENGFEEYETREDLDYPIYPICIGDFIVDSCKKQANMLRRDVVCYGNYINTYSEINPFEQLKQSLFTASKTVTHMNPVYYALSNVSCMAEIDFDSLGIDEFSSHTNLFEDYSYLIHARNSVVGFDWNIRAYTRRLNLVNYANYGHMFAYTTGEPLLYTKKTLKEAIDSDLSDYREHISDFAYNRYIGTAIKRLNPLCAAAFVESGNRYTKEYNDLTLIGLIDPKIENISFQNDLYVPDKFWGEGYFFEIPYALDIEIYNDGVLVETFTYDYYEHNAGWEELYSTEDLIGRIRLPQVSLEITRKKTKENNTTIYKPDIADYPTTKDVFDAFLELNGCFFTKDRQTNLYKFKYVDGASEHMIYPSNETYPDYNVYPVCSDIELNTYKLVEKALVPNGNLVPGSELYPGYYITSDYKTNVYSAWYDDEEFEPYTAISAKYKDENEEESSIYVYVPEYETEETILDSDTYTGDTEDDFITFEFNNPFSDNDTAFIDAQGLRFSAWAENNGAIVFRITEEDIHCEYTSDAWSTVDKVCVEIYCADANEGDTYTISIGNVARTEIEVDHKTLEMDSNYILSNYTIDSDELQAMLQDAVEDISKLHYMPATIKKNGIPYVEAGDSIVLITRDEIIKTNILERNMSGVVGLVDDYSST